VGIEPTRDGITAAQTGFEVQATHQDRSASTMIITRDNEYIFVRDKCQIYAARVRLIILYLKSFYIFYNLT
jgi:hypothetical protein